jgi:hypothetical protein
MPMGQTIGGDGAQTCFQTKVSAASGRVVVEQKDVLVGSPGDRRQNRKISERLRRIGVPKVDKRIDVVCVLAYTLPTLTARWCYEVPLRSGYRSLAARIPPMGRVPSSAITLVSCLSACLTKIAVTHPHVLTGFNRPGASTGPIGIGG